MRRLAAIPLLLWFLALGTGLVGFAHELDHRCQDTTLTHSDHPKPASPTRHNDTNCLIHAQLHMPLLAAGAAPLLHCVGLFIAFLTLAAPTLSPQRALCPVGCRGPPAC